MNLHNRALPWPDGFMHMSVGSFFPMDVMHGWLCNQAII